jgi:alkyl hydroperoxide reductase subunit AhpC
MKFYEEHADKRDRFEIIAFHDARATSLDDMDTQLKSRNIIDQHWGGKHLPFPILHDASGDTIRSMGIRAFPTLLLVDPDGKLVATRANQAMLLEKLTGGDKADDDKPAENPIEKSPES